MPINFDALKQAQLDQFVADLEVEKQKGPTAGDYGRALGVGAADIPVSVGEGLSLLGLEKIGGAVRGFGEDVQESLVEGMTLGGRRASTAPILESDTPIATTGMKLAQSLPAVLAAAVPGALATRGLGAVGKAAGIKAITPKVLKTGATLPTKSAVALGFGSSAGVYSGLSNAAQTRSEIMNQDIETLSQNPLYQKHLAGVDPALAEGDRQQLAREAASREAEWDVATKTALTTGIITAIGGGGVFAALARPTGGIAREAAKGMVREAATEAPQSALEQVHRNVALNRPTTEGAGTAAIEGGILGGLLGGGIGGINAAFTVPGTTQADIDTRPAQADAPAVAPAAVTPAAPKAFTDLSPEETEAVARAALAEAALRSAAAQAQAQAAGQFPSLVTPGDAIPFTPPTAAPLTTSPGAAPESRPVITPIGIDRYAFAGLDKMVPKAPVLETIDFEPAPPPELTTSPGAAPPATHPRADQIGVNLFAFKGLDGLETSEAAEARIAALRAQGAPRSTDPKLPKSFRGKTAEEFEAELETSTLSAKTVAKAEQHLNTVLRPQAQAQAEEIARLQEVVATAAAPLGEGTPPVTAPEVVDASTVAQDPGIAPVEGISAPHQAQYRALMNGYTQAGLEPTLADGLLRANYNPATGFDQKGLLNTLTEAYSAPVPAELQGAQAPAKPQRGRPTKEQQIERAAATAPQGVISDPDPDVQENARAIIADAAKLAQLRQMATEPDAHPLTRRLKKAVDELMRAAPQPIPVSSRPPALGPNYFSDADELVTWQNLRAEFVAAGVTPDEAEAILARNYDDITGFDTEVLAAELQVAEKDQDIDQAARAAAADLTADDLTATVFSGTTPRQAAPTDATYLDDLITAAAETLKKVAPNAVNVDYIAKGKDVVEKLRRLSVVDTEIFDELANKGKVHNEWFRRLADIADAIVREQTTFPGQGPNESALRSLDALGTRWEKMLPVLARENPQAAEAYRTTGTSLIAAVREEAQGKVTPSAAQPLVDRLATIRAAARRVKQTQDEAEAEVVLSRGSQSVDAVYRPALEAFIKGPQVKTWLEFPSLKVYVRKAKRRIAGGPAVDTFDLANIHVDESMRGSGLFTKFLDVLEHVTEEAGLSILVEEIQNPKLPAFFKNRGYTILDDSASPNAFKPATLDLHHHGLSLRAATHKVANVQAIVDRMLKQWKRPPFGGVQVHDSIASLPQGLQSEVYSRGAQGGKHAAKGIYDPATGTVHLIASNLATPQETEFVLFHEVLGHFGLRGFLKSDFAATMRELYRQNSSLRLAVNALRKEFKDYDLETATEEVLSDIAGRNLHIKGTATLLAKIQKALRAIGLDSVANWLEKRTNAEVLHVLAQAKLFVTEGKGAPHIYTSDTSKLLYSYAGVNAARANLKGLKAAEEFEALGLSKAQIRATTGWFRGLGKDTKWRFEISDTDAKFGPNFDNARFIADVLDHPTLFANYPALQSVPFRWEDLPIDDMAKLTNWGRIIVNSRLDDATALSAILHELQHIIQAAEGFARGGGATTPEVVEAAAKAGGTPKALFEVYQHLAGEIEARDVQARALMTDEERALNEPYTSETLTRAPIIRFSRTGQEALSTTAHPASPLWYSEMEKFIDAKAPGKTTAAQWKVLLDGWTKSGKFKADELEWSGVKEWLDLQQPPQLRLVMEAYSLDEEGALKYIAENYPRGATLGVVTKDQVLGFVREKGVQVEETTLSDEVSVVEQITAEDVMARSQLIPPAHEESSRWRLNLPDKDVYLVYSREDQGGEANALAQFLARLRHSLKNPRHHDRLSRAMSDVSPPTKYAKWQLPGGENYREVLLRLPVDERNTDQRIREIRERDAILPNTPHSTFAGGHFDQPNILAHVRFNERTDAEGRRVLFLEEIQSDWAQTGKREGFERPKEKARALVEENAAREAYNAARDAALKYKVGGGDTGGQRYQQLNDAIKVADERLSAAMGITNAASGNIPSAPFVTKTEAWVSLALKRMIRHAAANGFDRIAWTTGEQQAGRYDLSKHVEVVNAFRREDGLYELSALPKDGSSVDQEIGTIEEKKLAATLGKDLAEKIAAQPGGWHHYDGLDLKVGGAGIRAFYDKIVPNIANALLKKLGGGRVGTVSIPLERRTLLGYDEWYQREYGSLPPLITPESHYEAYQRSGANAERVSLEESDQPGFDIPPDLRESAVRGIPLFSRKGQDAAAELSAQVGEFYNFSAPFQRAFRKLAAFGSKSSAARAVRLGLSRTIASPYHLATAKKADGTPRSHGFANIFQNVLRQQQQFSDYIVSTLQEPIQKTWVQGQGLGKPPAQFEAAARALFAHNDSGVTTAEFFNDPANATGLDPKARELYDQVREVMRRGLMAEFTAKAIRMQEVIADPKIYNETIQELYNLTQQRIDRGFIPNRRHGEYAVGAYHAEQLKTDTAGRKYFTGQPMQWYTFESIGEAQSAAKELRTLFQGQTDIVLDIDALGNGQPLTVERSANDRYSTSSYWDFLQHAKTAGIPLDDAAKGRLAKLMISSESALQNKIQRRRGVPGYSKDLMRVLGEFITSTGFSVAHTQMSARTQSAMDKRFFLSEADLQELAALREQFKDFAAASESKVYESLTQEPDLTKRFARLVAYGRMKYLEVSGGQFWAQDGADKGFYRSRADELISFLESPKASWADGARTYAALHFLGGSVASAVVNLSSLPMFSAPYLHQYIGAKAYPLLTKHFKNFTKYSALRDLTRLAAALDPQQRGSGQAAQDWKTLEPLGEDLLAAVQRAAEEGIISDSQIHELFGFARGGLLAHSGVVRKGISAWMAPFRLTEQANRFATFMAAFDAGEKGIADGKGGTKKLSGAELYTFARDAVDQTQSIYGPINRQPWARNPIGHALFTFRAFPLMMGELMLRLPSPQRTLALGSLVLAAGINGIPFADDLRDIIDTIAHRVFGAPLNTRRLMTNMVAQASEAALGVDLSRLIMNGSLDALTGAAVSGRIGFGNLIPGTRAFAAGEDFFGRTMKDVLGPVGVEAENFAKAFQGDLTALLPSAARNVGKAIEAARYGKLTDAKGQTLIDDVTGLETAMQGIGFTSGRLSQAYETQRGLFQEQAYVDEVKQGFLNDIRKAVAHNDVEALSDVGDEINAWNETHTQWPIVMEPSQIRSTLKLAGLPLTERTLKLLPRAWRAAQ